jgi:hypothetical protein
MPDDVGMARMKSDRQMTAIVMSMLMRAHHSRHRERSRRVDESLANRSAAKYWPENGAVAGLLPDGVDVA